MITTDKFDLTKNEYLTVNLKVLLKKKWWKFLLYWLLAIFLTFESDKNALLIVCMIFLYSFPFLMVFEYWRFANAKENRKIFGERYYEISADQINAYLWTGSQSVIKFEQFVKKIEIKDYLFLYISKSQSLYFPKRIFKREEDLAWFKENVFDKVR